ncbi:hypothetical protein HZ994_08040 [Akkermansiaceae bacterium]|nr:hypothetical protein HZ994_08040 [Akkermansiaceae bacterium]
MDGVTIREAVAADHAALERLFSETSMAGAIRIGSDRSPDFFAASRVQAATPCVWAAFAADGRAAGVFSAGKRLVHLGGEKIPLRYLSDLRIHPDWRSGTLLARGFRSLREKVFAEGEWAQTLVLEGNAPALEILRSGRMRLPQYRPAGRYVNWLLPQQAISRYFPVRTACEADLPAMQCLLDDSSRRRSFSAAVDLGKLGGAFLNGLVIGDFLVAEDAGEIRGMIALWDQGGFQRLRVDGYSPAMAVARPFWNLAALIRGGAKLPRRGRTIPIRKASMLACADDDPSILKSLLSAALFSGNGGLLSVGLSEKDPLAAALSGLKGKVFRGRHFLVGWEGEPPEWREPFGFDPGRI